MRVCAQIISRQLSCAILALLAASATVPAGADVKVDGDPNTVQNEISLTLVHGQSGQLAMAYNDYLFSQALGIAYSTDNGNTWGTTQLQLPLSPGPGGGPPGPPMGRAFDPTITSDANGKLYAGFIADGAQTLGGAPDSGLYVATSTDGGQNWGTPVQVSYDPPSQNTIYPDPNYRFNDRDQITADRFPNSPHYGNVYASWIRDRGWYNQYDPNNPPGFSPPADIYFSRSTDGGVSYSSRLKINDANQNLGGIPVPRVAKDGTIYVGWADFDVWTGGTATLWLDKSTDGGNTWGTDQQVKQVVLPPVRVTKADGTLDASAKGAPLLATCPTDANVLYFVYDSDPDGPGGDDGDIFLIKSTDGGQNWGTAVQVNDDANTTNDQVMPWMDIKPDGTIDIAWYDRRNDPNDALWDIYIARSTDGGATFLANIQINDPNTSYPTPLGGTWMGEYLGLAVDGNDAYVAWCSSLVDNNGDIYFDKIANSAIPEPAALAVLGFGAVALFRKRKKT